MKQNSKYIPVSNSSGVADTETSRAPDSELQDSSSGEGTTSESINGQVDIENLPADPPAYEEGSFEQFEIEEPESSPQSEPHGIFNKAGEFARNINTRIFRPLTEALDPVYQAWQFINKKVDACISKIGNPLIVKRLIYVLFIAVLIYMVSLNGAYSGGRLSNGTFEDLDALAEFIDNEIDSHRLEENLEYLSSMPRIAGTAGDLSLARYIEQYIKKTNVEQVSGQQFQAFTEYPSNESYVVLKNSAGELIYRCNLVESTDLDGQQSSVDISRWSFNPGSRTGKVSARVVYANYGQLQDYEYLRDAGVNLDSGFVALVKYGGGLPAYKKIKYAHRAGAKAVIFISDPLNTSYSLYSIQRDPVAYPDKASGNIMDPGPGSADQIPEYFDPEKLLATSSAYPDIPSMPISWADFIGIMNKFKSSGKHISEWDFSIGNTPVEIWTGDDQFKLDMDNHLQQRPFKQMWNVAGRISGTEQNGLAIMIGASRDALCYGATEATGTAVLLELMTVLSELKAAKYWRPLRTIYFVSFSGSKFNAAGTSNFVVQKSDFLRHDLYAYIDLSDAISGSSFTAMGNSLLYHPTVDQLDKVNDPVQNVSISQSWNHIFDTGIDITKQSAPFLVHDGIPILELAFRNSSSPNGYPKNTCLDTFDRFKKAGIDPEMKYHKTLTSILSRIILELSDNAVISFDIPSLVSDINKDARDLRKYTKIKMKDSGMMLNFDGLEKSLIRIKQIAQEQKAFVGTWTDIVTSSSGMEPNLLAVNRWDWNSKLSILLKLLIAPQGVYQRPWQKNAVFGQELEIPQQTDEFGKVINFRYNSFPGVRDALDEGKWDQAQAELNKITGLMDEAAEIFNINM